MKPTSLLLTCLFALVGVGASLAQPIPHHFTGISAAPDKTVALSLHGTNSSFMGTLWYPAEPPKVGSLPATSSERAVAGDRNLYTFWGWSSQWTNVVPQLVAYSMPEAPLASGQDRFPLILYSHGWTCDRRLNSQNAEELASHGYIVAAVDHEDCHATAYPDDRGTRFMPPGSVSTSSVLVSSRLKDIQVLLEELGRMDTSDPLLAGRLDLGRIGMIGFSYGGGTAAETCRRDSRVKCVALLDAAINYSHYSQLSGSGPPDEMIPEGSDHRGRRVPWLVVA
jgi:predicted dienelactone hydrolase